MALNWKFWTWWRKAPKKGYVMPELGGDVPEEVWQFLANHQASLDEEDASIAEHDAAIQKVRAVVEKYKGDSDSLLAALTLAVQHMKARQKDRRNKTAEILQWLARITSAVAIVAVLSVGGAICLSSSLHPPQEVARVNFPMSLVG
jgi:hypothetical protein